MPFRFFLSKPRTKFTQFETLFSKYKHRVCYRALFTFRKQGHKAYKPPSKIGEHKKSENHRPAPIQSVWQEDATYQSPRPCLWLQSQPHRRWMKDIAIDSETARPQLADHSSDRATKTLCCLQLIYKLFIMLKYLTLLFSLPLPSLFLALVKDLPTHLQWRS